jgi:DnaK suppressor protein
MTQAEREEIRNTIKNEISTLEESIDTLTELISSEVQSDANDWFTTKDSNPSGEINELALDKARQRIIILNDVLRRIERSDYGICVKCNKPIPFERMKAVPTATRCVSCG